MANNNWHPHMMKVFHEMRKLNSETKLMDAMKEAKKTYKKAQNGGKQRKSKSKSKLKSSILSLKIELNIDNYTQIFLNLKKLRTIIQSH